MLVCRLNSAGPTHRPNFRQADDNHQRQTARGELQLRPPQPLRDAAVGWSLNPTSVPICLMGKRAASFTPQAS